MSSLVLQMASEARQAAHRQAKGFLHGWRTGVCRPCTWCSPTFLSSLVLSLFPLATCPYFPVISHIILPTSNQAKTSKIWAQASKALLDTMQQMEEKWKNENDTCHVPVGSWAEGRSRQEGCPALQGDWRHRATARGGG